MLYYQVVDKIASQAINLNDKEHIQNIEILVGANRLKMCIMDIPNKLFCR